MHKLNEKLEPICDMMKTLTDWAEEELGKGKACVNTQEMGMVIDMIKDLANAEKNLNKACYYHKIVEAMHEAKEEEELMGKIFQKMQKGEELSDSERMGYDHWRYSSGRYAPKGRGHYSGYTPWRAPTYVDDDMDEMATYGDENMGYGGRYSSGSRSTTSSRPGYTPIDQFRMAKRNYTQTHSSEDKAEMNEHAKHHMKESIDTMKEIWKDADPELKNKMKSDISSFLKEMG